MRPHILLIAIGKDGKAKRVDICPPCTTQPEGRMVAETDAGSVVYLEDKDGEEISQYIEIVIGDSEA